MTSQRMTLKSLLVAPTSPIGKEGKARLDLLCSTLRFGTEEHNANDKDFADTEVEPGVPSLIRQPLNMLPFI